jgi:ABC-type dipeptide/oligopeptide/nickel transport system permease subunit
MTHATAQRVQRSLWGDAAARFRRNRLSVAALLVVLTLAGLAVFAPWLAPSHFDAQHYDRAWQRPSTSHIMGTDPFGRDVLSRVIYGARVSLSVALVVNAASLLIGLPLGALAGWFGGVADYALMRLVDLLSAIPRLLLAILMMTVLGSGLLNIYIVMAATGWIHIARLVRGQVLTLRERDFVTAARAIGASDRRIVLHHLLPNCLSVIVVSLTLDIPHAIMTEAGLSFLGVGVNAPLPSWGKMLSEYLPYIQTYWHLSVFPALMIAVTMYAFTLLGDGLQDALDPQATYRTP